LNSGEKRAQPSTSLSPFSRQGFVCGTIPAVLLEPACETVRAFTAKDLTAMVRVTVNAMKHYRQTRPKASPGAVASPFPLSRPPAIDSVRTSAQHPGGMLLHMRSSFIRALLPSALLPSELRASQGGIRRGHFVYSLPPAARPQLHGACRPHRGYPSAPSFLSPSQRQLF